MPDRPRTERITQIRAIRLFADTARLDCLGADYLGSWGRRGDNRCVEQVGGSLAGTGLSVDEAISNLAKVEAGCTGARA